MSHGYVVRSKVDKSGEEEKVRYYGVPVVSEQVTTLQLAEAVSGGASLTRGDVLGAVCELGTAIRRELAGGRSVHLDGIGTFFVSVHSEGCETPKECTPGKVKGERLCFKADPEMRNFIKKIQFERVKE